MVVFKPRKKSQQQKPSFSVGENAEKVTKATQAAQATKPTKARIPVSATDQATKTLAKYKRKWKTNGYSKNPYIFVCGHVGCGVTTGVNRRQLPREHDMQGHERHMNAIVWCIDIATFITDTGLYAARKAISFEEYYRLLPGKESSTDKEIESYKEENQVYDRTGSDGKGMHMARPLPNYMVNGQPIAVPPAASTTQDSMVTAQCPVMTQTAPWNAYPAMEDRMQAAPATMHPQLPDHRATYFSYEYGTEWPGSMY